MTSIHEIAERFAAAVGGADDPGLVEHFAPTVAVSHVYDDWDAPMEIPGAAMAANLNADERLFRQLMPDYARGDVRVFVGDDGFALTGTVTGTLADGTEVKYAYCSVMTVVDGKIARVMAYQDREMAAALSKAAQELMGQSA